MVVGGTGALGREVVPRLRARGHDVSVGTRTPRAPGHVRLDLTRPETVAAVAGHDVVVHTANDPFALRRVAVDGTAALVEAVREHAVPHLLLLSIVGVDDHPAPFYRAQAAAEQIVEDADVPHTILRATQFHGLVGRFLDELLVGPVIPVPRDVRLRPVDAGVVAERVVELVEADPAGRADPVTGPEVVELRELVRRELAARGRRALLVPLPLVGSWDRACRDGRMLGPRAGHGPTHGEHLARVPRPRRPAPDPVLRVLAVVWAAVHVGFALDPAAMHATIATFGSSNEHLFHDIAAAGLPYAVALWLASSRPSWRRPVVGLTALGNGLHLVSHVVDVGAAASPTVGVGTIVVVAATQVVLWIAWRRSPATAVRGATVDAPSPGPHAAPTGGAMAGGERTR